MIACTQLFGIFKLGLPKDERESFKILYGGKFTGSVKTNDFLIEGKNSIVFYRPLQNENIIKNMQSAGGMCFLSFNNKDKKTTDNSNVEKFDSLKGTWAMAEVEADYGVSLGIDPEGVQSLFYLLVDDRMYFASTLTLFRKLVLEIDIDAVNDFLHFLYIPAPRSIYRHVKSLLPGEVVSFDGKKLKSDFLNKKRFSESQTENLVEKDHDQLLFEYEKQLKDSIRRSVSEYGKTALLLSGGKDSSALAIAISRAGLKNVESVAFGFEKADIDEASDAKLVADHLGIPFTMLSFPVEYYIKNWPEFVKGLGQPMGDCAALPVFAGIKELNNRFDIYLDGTGNDGYMGSPTNWQIDFAWYLHRNISNLHKIPWKLLRNDLSYSIDIIAKQLSSNKEEQFVSWNGWSAKEIFRLTGKKVKWKDSELYRLYKYCRSPMVHKTITLGSIWGPGAARRKAVQLGNVMGKLAIFPFLEDNLVEFCRDLPSEYLYRGRVNKIILRSLLKKYLPDQIVNKKKGSFIFPKDSILDYNNYKFLDLFLSPESIKKYGLVDDKIVRSYVQQYKMGNRFLEDRIWALLLLHSWKEFCCNN